MKRVVVITGGSSGIGETTARYLSHRGDIVYSLSRTKKDIFGIHYLECDVTSIEQVRDSFIKIIGQTGKIDVVINNAGIGIGGPVENTKMESIKQIINVNMMGVFNVCKIAIPYLKISRGKIINIGSVAGELTIPFQTFYSVTKSAIMAYSEGLALELKPFGVKVTCILPGDTKTSFTKNRENEVDINKEYSVRYYKSITKMEEDEKNGMLPIAVSKVIYRTIKKKNPGVKVVVGFSYRFLLFLKRFLPERLVLYILYKMYG
ncbi:MAG TPA: SDR family NAD(P)-dependent oxidoreductase [Bacilli bacterium]|jgi:short-subunit dehydrogenase|nr:SDR family NAD(P)-dependent oxidoreductase [Bacilli bacterium]